jgi:heterodisulfide reductase subunit B2
MTYAFFLGCTIPARSRGYEISARKIAEKLDFELRDMAEFVCCGYPMKASDQISSELMGAYNLALAEKAGLDVCTLCSSCASYLTEVACHLAEEGPKRDAVNNQLSRVGLEYKGNVKVRHFVRILFEEVEPKEIKKHFKRDLDDLSIALHYGCHYLKPSGIYDNFDPADHPKSIEKLVSMTGARVVNYAGEQNCCGGPLLPVDEKTALSLAKEKLDAVFEIGADALCVVCPFCSVMYDSNQKTILSESATNSGFPVLYLTQLLGLAMGFGKKELGLQMNVVKPKELLKKYFP